MTLTDETLMAYADGEVDAETRAVIESAMREDPEVRRRVERHRALREAVQGAFSSVLDEPVPDRLIAAARGQGAAAGGKVVDLLRARAAVRAPVGAPLGLRRWQPAAMAASLLIGLGLGYIASHHSNALVKSSSSGLIAGAALDEALSSQLSADRAAGSVAATGTSFRSKTGDYCRTFSLSGADSSSGLACREGNSWKIKVLAQSPHPAGDPSNFRQAGSADSPAVRAAVEESIAGEPLDQAGEIAARRRGWAANSGP
jgi:anti-sigma factor RsiW